MNDIVWKKRKKFILIILITIAAIVLLGTIFGIVDYFRAVNGKKPIFIYHTVNTTNLDVTIAGFEDTALSNKEGAYYYGIGYNISICDNEAKNYTFQLGHKQKEPCSTSLTCTKVFAENDKHSFDYSFFDGKLYRLSTTLLIPANQIAKKEIYEKEFMKINDVAGCGATFKKINETTYETMQICNISKMSSSDVKRVYTISKKSLEQTRNEIIDGFSHDKDMICK